MSDINTKAWELVRQHMAEDGSIPATRINSLVIDIACSYIGVVNERVGTIRKYTDPLLKTIADLERQIAELTEPMMDKEYGPVIMTDRRGN